MLSNDCYAVVMAGGAGTRLWPLSSRDVPKHFLKLFAGKSLIELTVDKLSGHIPDDRIIILTSVNYKTLARETLPQVPSENFVYEPCVRDTASAIGLAATVLKTRCATATMIVLTADQIQRYVAHRGYHFADGCTRSRRVDQWLHHVLAGRSRFSQTVQCSLDFVGTA